MRPSRLALVALACAALVAAPGCRRKAARADDPGTGATPGAGQLPELVVTDDTPDLLLTWIDAKGDGHTAMHPADVPMEGRDRVRVVVTTRDEGTGEVYWVADLGAKGASGGYRVFTMAAAEWDALISARRAARLAAATPGASASGGVAAPGLAPAPGGSAVGAPAGALVVVLYGASWCGPCHEAMDYMKRRHIPAIEKDIEQDPTAAGEMQAKLARVGRHGGSIPVLDVAGTILVGWSPNALETAYRAALAKGTTL